jgi:hypothetical protein
MIAPLRKKLCAELRLIQQDRKTRSKPQLLTLMGTVS